MNFIFPKNYNFKNKLFGFMDYITAAVNVLWGFIVFGFINIFPLSLNIKIGSFIIFYFPLLLFSIFGFNNENIVYVFSYLLKFIIRARVYFFSKD